MTRNKIGNFMQTNPDISKSDGTIYIYRSFFFKKKRKNVVLEILIDL